jgi:hypothetical protein
MLCSPMVDLPDRITRILTPHLGAHTADSVARHLCAKHEIGDGAVSAEKAQQLEDTIRRGLVAFVGAEKAEQLARKCFEGIVGST